MLPIGPRQPLRHQHFGNIDPGSFADRYDPAVAVSVSLAASDWCACNQFSHAPGRSGATGPPVAIRRSARLARFWRVNPVDANGVPCKSNAIAINYCGQACELEALRCWICFQASR
jgi:hypothetical protein